MTHRPGGPAAWVLHALAAVLLLCTLSWLLGRGAASAPISPGQDRPAKNIILPNVDDDDSDGVPDFEARSLDGAVEDDLLQVRVKPDVALPEGAVLRAEVPEPWTQFIRILTADPVDRMFRPIPNPLRLNPGDAGRNGVGVAVESSAFAGPGRDGTVQILFRFETRDGAPISRQTVTCAVAPFLMSSGLDPADAVHVVRTKATERFVNDLEPLTASANVRLLAFEDARLPERDMWIQDATEIGYATDGQRLMHVALHGNRGRELDDLFATAFLGRNSGVIHPGGFRGRDAEWIDWFGNLEVSPPLAVGNRAYPRGSIYAVRQGDRSMHPDVISFLEAQKIQAPVLWLDTSWLVIGHVDEVVSWVPSKVGRSYRMLVPSPRLALEILRRAEKDAPGCLLNRGTRRDDTEAGELADAPVAQVLNDLTVLAGQEFVQNKIDAARRTLQAELGIADADIIEIPVLFGTSPGRFEGRYDALTTNMVNSLLVGETFIVPDPHGPVVNGKDVLLQAVRDRLEPLGCKVVAIDDFYPYHRYGGEVHCGTNATRHPR